MRYWIWKIVKLLPKRLKYECFMYIFTKYSVVHSHEKITEITMLDVAIWFEKENM
jgi:hypothetical protein